MFNVATDPTMETPETNTNGRMVDPHAEEWERTYTMFTHLSLLTVHLLVPVLPALAMWLIKRDKSPFVDDHGREAVNFQISLLLYTILSALLIPACGIGALFMLATYILGLVGMVIAAIAANRGEYYRYPATIRFLH